jgi:hypothetical protein
MHPDEKSFASRRGFFIFQCLYTSASYSLPALKIPMFMEMGKLGELRELGVRNR